MGLATSMTTALTGLRAAETQIEVTGNNLANAQTVGFKAGEVVLASQFYRTLSVGAAPSNTTGGSNPRQIGLGVQVAEISADFTQGTIEASNRPTDLAIQGDGFFIVQGDGGERLYTRNGVLRLNSQNELVTATGLRLLGYMADENFVIQEGALVPLSIPVGTATVSETTTKVTLSGNINPLGDVADTASVIESAILGDGSLPAVPTDDILANPAPVPDITGLGASSGPGTSGFSAGEVYEYAFTFRDASGEESARSEIVSVTVAADNDAITLTSLPASDEYGQVNIYRRLAGEADFRLVGTVPQGAASFVDNGIPPGDVLDETVLTGVYTYLLTFGGPGLTDTRPSEPVIVSVTGGRIHFRNLPTPPSGPGIPPYSTVNIYRNTLGDPETFYLVASVPPGQDFTDGRPDEVISDPNQPGYKVLDREGPRITASTKLVNVLQRDGFQYQQVFQPGTLEFTPVKGNATLTTKSLEITDDTTVGDLLLFLRDTSGIQPHDPNAANPIPGSANHLDGTGTLLPGGSVTPEGRLRLVSNNGVLNAVSINNRAFSQVVEGTQRFFGIGFHEVQEARGESASVVFRAYDSLGAPLDIRLTAVLESRDSSSATFRWYADAGDNDPAGPDHKIAVGTGLITFDSEGKVIKSADATITVLREDVSAESALLIEVEPGELTALSGTSGLLADADGAPPGQLASFSVGEDGTIRGAFNNGLFRPLGQIRLARFANPVGLEQRSEGLYAEGANSGPPVEGNPGQFGLGTIVGGALELSNTDIGESLVSLVLASTHYRSSSRVITTAQDLLDDLLNIRR